MSAAKIKGTAVLSVILLSEYDNYYPVRQPQKYEKSHRLTPPALF
jgi:hypothetical protein